MPEFFAVFNPNRGNKRFTPSGAHIEEWGLRTRTGAALQTAIAAGLVAFIYRYISMPNTLVPVAFAMLAFAFVALATAASWNELRHTGGNWDHVVVPRSFDGAEHTNGAIAQAAEAGLLPDGFDADMLTIDRDELLATVARVLGGLTDPHERFAFARAARDLHEARFVRADLVLAGKLKSARAANDLVRSLEATLSGFEVKAAERAERAAEARRMQLAAAGEADEAAHVDAEIEGLAWAAARASALLAVAD